MKIFLCPSNRSWGKVDFSPLSQALMAEGILTTPLPNPAATDYLMCKGANAALSSRPGAVPAEARGVFDVGTSCSEADILRGTANTFLFGEGAGNSAHFVARRNYSDTSPAENPLHSGTGTPILIDQGWGQGLVENGSTLAKTNYCYGSVFGVTAQCGGFPDYGPFDEPLNGMPDSQTTRRRLILAAVDYGRGDDNGPSVSPFDTLSGFRSMHPGGAQFCFADGSVHFIKVGLDPDTYRALSTRARAKAFVNGD